MQVLKGIAVVLVTIFLFALSQGVNAAQKPDLDGATLQDHGQCGYNEAVMPCALYKKGTTLYLLYATREGIVLIYRVKKGAKQPFANNELTLLWSKSDKQSMI
jgi:hypothetical protein